LYFKNSLLSAISADDIAILRPLITESLLAKDQSIYQPGDVVATIWFPTSAVLSVVTPLHDGSSVETETVGHESAAGLMGGLSRLPATNRAFAQIGGLACKLPAGALRERMGQSPALTNLVLQHLDLAVGQAQQSVACNAVHAAAGRLARWILMTQDRVGDAEVPLTHGYLAVMLGVQRSTISMLAQEFKAAGIIHYARGRITIVQRSALERAACECYAVGRDRLVRVGALNPQPRFS
jgi:CRP-like cAMP-binding protein